jgi:hypothetical protein
VAVRVSLLVALVVPIVHFASVFPLTQNVPKWDQWSMMPLWSAHFHDEGVLRELFRPYNGHCNFVPRAVFFLLGLATSWNVRAEVVLSYLAALVTLAALLQMLRDSGRELLLLAGIVALQVFSLVQFENYMSGYPFGQVLSQMAATLSLLLLTRPKARRCHWVGAAILAAVATFSWGAGLAAWLVGGLALFVRSRESRARLLVWWGAAAIVALVVWKVAHRSGMALPGPSSGLFDVHFLLVILGKPISFVPLPTVGSAGLLGLALLGTWLSAAAAAWSQGQRELVERWGLLGLLAVTGCVLITLGRARAGLPKALASHYATAAYPLAVSTLVLVAAVLAAAFRRAEVARRWLPASAFVALLAVAALQPLAASYRMLGTLRSWNEPMETAIRRLKAGTISDAEIRRYFHPNPTLVRRGRALLRRHSLAWYHDEPAETRP